MTTPPNTPPTAPPVSPTGPRPAPDLPLTPKVRTAYRDLYKAYEDAIENTSDPGVLEALLASQLDVDNILTKDDMYRLHANTALYDALLKQIECTNDDLEKLKAQIQAISAGVSTFDDILAAITKVLALLPAV